ncbi:MAG TPA: xylulose kinase, partial [Candidatus Rokubacteria bacterium]|nr:xylulose kinase [Candidatus Rokubacteria bacterium]
AVQEVRAAILLSNTRHLDQRVRELAAGPWAWGGISGDPPEAAFTVSRAAWEAR